MNMKSFLDKLGITYLLDIFKNIFVHKTGDETINGIKTFNNLHKWADDSLQSDSSIQIQNSLMNRGDVQDENTVYSSIVFLDKTSDVDMNGSSRVACFEIGRFNQVSSGNYGYINLKMYDPTTTDGVARAYLQTGYRRNGTPWAACTETPDESAADSNNLIVTKSWIPKDTRIVHTTGNEDITGLKTFNGHANVINLKHDNSILNNGTKPSANQYLTIQCLDSNNNRIGYVETRMDKNGNNSLRLGAYQNAASNGLVTAIGVAINYDGTRVVYPDINGGCLLGQSALRWKEIWCTQSSINSSSDERLKDNIKNITDEVLNAWKDIHWNEFQFKDAIQEKGSDKARIHSGLIAQQIDTIFKNHNLDARDYGFFLYDKWEAEEEEKDENGKVIKEAVPAGDSYGLRYTECLAIEAAYQRRKVKQLEEKNKQLEDTIASLISRIEALENK